MATTNQPDRPYHRIPRDDILILGPVSLDLRHHVLVIKDKSVPTHCPRLCYPFAGAARPSGLPIPVENVLWAEVVHDNAELRLSYAAVSAKKTSARVAHLAYPVDDAPVAEVARWVEELLERAYGPAQRRKRAKVLVNPHAGPGGADKIWERDVRPLFEAARMELDVVRTTYSGEAVGLCEQLDVDAYDVVVPCSGDGLPYEVFNGLARRPDARRALHQLPVAHIPCGSGNAMSCNLNGSYRPSVAALAVIKGVPTPLDLISITQGEQRIVSFLSQALGIIADCDLGTEHMRWMGPARFNVGMVQRIFSKTLYPCTISAKVELADKDDIRAQYNKERNQADHTQRREGRPGPDSVHGGSTSSEADLGDGLPALRYGTINDKVPADWETTEHARLGNFYCGNMAYMAPDANFFAAACPNDGLMDLVTANGDIPVSKYIDMVLSIESGRLFDNDLISYRKVSAYRVVPRQTEGYISIDGERVPFEPFQAEVHQGLGTVLSRRGRYEAPGPGGWETAAPREQTA